MKYITLFFSLFLFCQSLLAQDLIVTHQLDSIDGKISKVDERFIYYRYFKDGRPIDSMIKLDMVRDYKWVSQEPGREMVAPKNYNAYKSSRIALDLGFSSRIGRIDPSLSSSEKQHIKGLMSGFHFGVDAQYFFSESYGVGLDINHFQSQNTSNLGFGEFTEKMGITFLGPGFYSRSVSASGSNAFILGFNMGYLGARSSTMINSAPLLVSGGTFGTNVKVGYDIGMKDAYALGFSLRLIGGILNQITTKFNGTSNKISLADEDRENLARIDLSVGLRF